MILDDECALPSADTNLSSTPSIFYMKATSNDRRVPQERGASRLSPRRRLQFCIGPTDGSKPSVRTGLTCAIFNPSPRAANLGRRPFLEALLVPFGEHARNRSQETCAIAGGQRCGPHTTTETRRCCCGCLGRCCPVGAMSIGRLMTHSRPSLITATGQKTAHCRPLA
jgi:hypothetical protein